MPSAASVVANKVIITYFAAMDVLDRVCCCEVGVRARAAPKKSILQHVPRPVQQLAPDSLPGDDLRMLQRSSNREQREKMDSERNVNPGMVRSAGAQPAAPPAASNHTDPPPLLRPPATARTRYRSSGRQQPHGPAAAPPTDRISGRPHLLPTASPAGRLPGGAPHYSRCVEGSPPDLILFTGIQTSITRTRMYARKLR